MSTTHDYEVGLTIGEGAYGQVVHARYKTSGQNVAIKIIEKVVLKKHPHMMNAIWNEQRLLRQMKDSNHVVNLLASFHDSECVYLVMDCALGGDLSHVIRTGILMMETEKTVPQPSSSLSSSSTSSWQKSIPHYGLQLVNALGYIHSQGIIHCDLKPENILCFGNGRIQLADFGCAIQMGSEGDDNSSTGGVNYRGTADYASPEILQGKPSQNLMVSVDLWSLGCIFYTFFQGFSPFHAESDALSVQSVMKFIKKQQQCSLDDPINNHPPPLQPNDDNNEGTKDCYPCPSSPFPPSRVTMPDVWKQLIHGLLRANPLDRLGSTSSSYASLSKSFVWQEVNLDQDPPFVAPEASWVEVSKTTPMRDGKHGWQAFLL